KEKLMLKTGIAASMVIVVAGCSGPSPGDEEDVTLHHQALSTGVYNFGTLAHPGACLDVPGSSTTDGTGLQEWKCNGTGAQSFRVDDIGGGWSRIVNTNSNKCVDVAWNGTADGTKIQIVGCNGSGAQAWRFVDAGNGFVRIVGQTSNKCIDVSGAN